jgi:hypothetical protein
MRSDFGMAVEVNIEGHRDDLLQVLCLAKGRTSFLFWTKKLALLFCKGLTSAGVACRVVSTRLIDPQPLPLTHRRST